MTIAISGELQTLVQQELASGQYGSADDVLLAAVRLLHERNERLAELRREILPALERLDRGEGKPLDMDAIKREARARFEQSN
jgi:antitoxin ParD1/3/4